jgi:hypothetical protein
MRDQIVDIFPLEPEVAFAVAEKNAVSIPPGRHFGATHHRREERVRDVGNDEADRLRLLGDHPARKPVRHIVEGFDRVLDPSLRLRVNTLAAVDDARDCHGGNPRLQGHIPKRYRHECSC